MLKTIITKEFLNNILNLRFMIGLVLCIIVTVACIMILAHDYRREMKDYNARINLEDEIWIIMPTLAAFDLGRCFAHRSRRKGFGC